MLNQYYAFLHAEAKKIYKIEAENPEEAAGRFYVFLMSHRKDLPSFLDFEEYTKYPSKEDVKKCFTILIDRGEEWLVDPTYGIKVIKRNKLFNQDADILNIS